MLKVDRLRVVTGAMSTRYIIHETLRQNRGGREYPSTPKPYVRIVARLAPARPTTPMSSRRSTPSSSVRRQQQADRLRGGRCGQQSGTAATSAVSCRRDFGAAFFPGEDGQEIDAEEARELVVETEGARS